MAPMAEKEIIQTLRDGAVVSPAPGVGAAPGAASGLAPLVPWKLQCDVSARFGVTLAETERLALEAGLLPARYQRNRETLSLEDQLRLFRSRVAVIGCGGLGGYVIEELARVGVGTLTLVDPDVFEEHNLNRQLLSSPRALGRSKVACAAERVAEINPAVTCRVHPLALGEENAEELLEDCDAVVDALDNVLVRRVLAAACRRLRIPLVHGAIAGWFGQVATQLPGEDLSPLLRGSAQGKGAETRLGNPSFTPAVVASLEAAETCKVLLGRGTALSKRFLSVNLLDMEMDQIRYE
ncbi:MAG: HesA/MoeB/ThiF family protein [Oligoflexia bacterium]|nr:HesA/MoeB/ThiF family protein [Oligoflexia bacterium]